MSVLPTSFTLFSPLLSKGLSKARRHALSLFWLFLVLASPALADHGPRASQLDGTRLCLDDASVESAIVRAGEHRDEALERRLNERLRDQMPAVLAALDVAFEERPSCAGRRDYVRMGLWASYLDPKTYINFPERSYSYTVALQVGSYEEIAALELEELLPSALHLLLTSALHSEADSPLDGHLLTTGEALIRALARAWWDDNAERYASSRRYAPQLIGGSLAVVAAALILLAKRRRG
jgi:hypothetical protein